MGTGRDLTYVETFLRYGTAVSLLLAIGALGAQRKLQPGMGAAPTPVGDVAMNRAPEAWS
jgi:hypothetical protein